MFYVSVTLYPLFPDCSSKDTTCSKGYVTTKTDKGTREFKVIPGFPDFHNKSSIHVLDVIIIQAKDCVLDNEISDRQT